jgi:predicted DNA-binding transcriptional regulator AlpA
MVDTRPCAKLETQMNALPNSIHSGDRILSPKKAAERLDKHRATIMRWSNDPRYAHLGFPRPIQLADGSVGFLEAELNDWIASRPRTLTTCGQV